ncbi:MAG: hypothetical protein AAF311_03510 [Pseudomonadota bacterium]
MPDLALVPEVYRDRWGVDVAVGDPRLESRLNLLPGKLRRRRPKGAECFDLYPVHRPDAPPVQVSRVRYGTVCREQSRHASTEDDARDVDAQRLRAAVDGVEEVGVGDQAMQRIGGIDEEWQLQDRKLRTELHQMRAAGYVEGQQTEHELLLAFNLRSERSARIGPKHEVAVRQIGAQFVDEARDRVPLR